MIKLEIMNPASSSDLQQSLITTIYSLFSHNYEAAAYFTGMIIGIILLIRRPSRFATFIMLGFAVLLFQFEYDKHIISALRDQTLTSLATAKPHLRFQRIVSVIITELMPIILYIAGWGMIYISIIAAALKKRPKKQ